MQQDLASVLDLVKAHLSNVNMLSTLPLPCGIYSSGQGTHPTLLPERDTPTESSSGLADTDMIWAAGEGSCTAAGKRRAW